MGAILAQPAKRFNLAGPCKIKLFFKGAESDDFINNIKTSINLEGVSLSINKTETEIEVESIQSLGTVAHATVDGQEGFVYELAKTYKKGAYSFKISYQENSLFFLKSYGCMSKSTNASCQEITDNTKQLYSRHFTKDSIYKVNGENTLYLIVEMGLNISINCEMQGANEEGEGKVYQGSERESLFVPLKYNFTTYTKDSEAFPSPIIQRRSKNFDKFLEGDGSIGFKAVNYRKNIYTGNSQHIFSGVSDEGFTTGLSCDDGEIQDYYQTEYIENKVYVMVECDKKQYLFDYTKKFKEQRPDVKSLTDLKIYDEKDIYDTKTTTSIQFLYLHLVFDGSSLKYKDMIFNSLQFKNGE